MGYHVNNEGWSLFLDMHNGYHWHKWPSHYWDDLRMLDTRHCHPKMESIYQAIKVGNSTHGWEAYCHYKYLQGRYLQEHSTPKEEDGDIVKGVV